MESSGPVLLRATMPRAQAIVMLALAVGLTLLLLDILIVHLVTRPGALPPLVRGVLEVLLVVMAAASVMAFRSWQNPPVLVEATAEGVRNAANRQATPIPWRDIVSFELERVITGDSRANVIVVRLRDQQAVLPEGSSYLPRPPKGVGYLAASAEPGGTELLRRLEQLHAAYLPSAYR